MPPIAITSAPHLSGGSARLEGVVQDLQTGRPLEGATVLLRPCGPIHDWTPFFRTGSDGAFHLAGLPEGQYQVEAGADGYLSHRHSPLPDLFCRRDRELAFRTLWLTGRSSAWDGAWGELRAADPVLRHQFPQAASGESVRITVALRAARVLTARVLTAAGAPVEGARTSRVHQRVWVGQGCFEVHDAEPATSDAQGILRLAVFPDADVELTVGAAGFAILHQIVPRTAEGPVDLVLAAAGPVRGRVVRSDGRVAMRTRVVLFNPADPETALSADANEEGAWSIENAPPAPFAVMAWHEYSGACWRVVHEPTSKLDLVLQPMRLVRGRVETPDGRPVGGEYLSQVFPFEWEGRTIVVNQTYQWQMGGVDKTNEDGRFAVPVALGADGKALIRFDYQSAPAVVDGAGDVRLVVSEQTARSRTWERSPSPPEAPAPSPSCPVPKAPKPDLHPADFAERNRVWIALLETDPPAERVALLTQLQKEIGAGG